MREESVEAVEKIRFLHLFEHRVVRAMPSLENCVGRNKDRKIVVPNVVKNIREAQAAEALTHHEAIGFKNREFDRAEAEIEGAIAWILRLLILIQQFGVTIKLFPVRGGGGIPLDCRNIFRVGLVTVGKLRGRDLSESSEALLEYRAVTEDLRSGGSKTKVGAWERGEESIKKMGVFKGN